MNAGGCPVESTKPIGIDSCRLGLDHQVGHVDVTGTLQLALLAVEAERCQLMELLGLQGSGREWPVECTDCVGFGSRAGVFGGVDAKEGAHSLDH